MELDWEGIAELLDKFPEGVPIGGEMKVSIPNTDIYKIAFGSIKQDDEYYYMIADIITVDDVVNSTVRIKLTNMLLDIFMEEFKNMQSNTRVDFTKEKEALAIVIKMLDDLDNK